MPKNWGGPKGPSIGTERVKVKLKGCFGPDLNRGRPGRRGIYEYWSNLIIIIGSTWHTLILEFLLSDLE